MLDPAYVLTATVSAQSQCNGQEIGRTTQFVLIYENTKLEKEREKEEVCGRYLSTFACTSVTQVNTKPSCLRLKTEP
jgi:hypothetical protein